MGKLVVQVKLTGDAGHEEALRATIRACNEAANAVSHVAFARGIWRNYDLRAVTYAMVRQQHGLGAQAAQHVIKKVADAYNSGRPEHRRGFCERRFHWSSSQPFDRRNLSWDRKGKTVSIWTLHGRIRVPYACAPWQDELLARPVGECDLVWRRGAFYLLATVDVAEAVMNVNPAGFIGVDLGIVNPATTSEGAVLPTAHFHPTRAGKTRKSHYDPGKHIGAVRYRNLMLRRKLQKKQTKAAKRRLAHLAGREARFAKDTNHCIAKQIVTAAKDTGRGIALEDLEGIRDRARFRKPQRVALNSWAFHELGGFVAYKAKMAGVPVVFVDPAYTSQTCSSCGHTTRKNRPTRDRFICTQCGLSLPADWNAAVNIASRGARDWAVSHAAERGTGLAA